MSDQSRYVSQLNCSKLDVGFASLKINRFCEPFLTIGVRRNETFEMESTAEATILTSPRGKSRRAVTRRALEFSGETIFQQTPTFDQPTKQKPRPYALLQPINRIFSVLGRSTEYAETLRHSSETQVFTEITAAVRRVHKPS